MIELVGQVLGNYRIDQPIGSGGMGQVFRGHHLHLDRVVAIKVMHPHLALDPRFQARFLQEAKAAASLRHPNIVEVFDFGEQAGRFYLVMELVEASLRTFLQRRSEPGSGWSVPLGLDLVRQAANGLGFAHSRGMLHRDVKPDNMLLPKLAGADGQSTYQLKVTDFGLARLAEGGVSTAAGLVVGTPAYMSPEQCQGGELDGRSDLYSLGVVLYEVATGYLPFETKNLSEAVYKHVYIAPPPPRQVKPDISPDLEAIILRGLAKKPEDRFATAADLVAALDQVIGGAPAGDAGATQVGGIQAQGTQVMPVLRPAATVLESPGTIPLAPIPTPRAPSSPGDRPTGPQVRVQDEQGRTIQVVPLGGDGLAVGRLPSNSIILESDAVSRHHLRIDWDGATAIVTDLGSTNGTYLGGRRLAGQVAERWPAVLPLLIGGFWLRLELPDVAGRTELSRAPAMTAIGMPPAATATASPPPSSARIGIVVEPETVTLTAGQPSILRATLANLGMTVDHFATTVEGVPGGWVELPDAPVQLNPGQKTTVPLRVLVPRVPESKAGVHQVTVRATSRENPRETGTADGAWTVLPFAASSLAVTPARARTRGEASYDVKLKNEGNAPATFDLAASDDERALTYRFDSPTPTLEGGQSTAVRLTAGRKRRLIGNAQTHGVQVRSEPRGGAAQVASVQLVHLALIPTWVPPLLLLVLAALGVLAYTLLTQAPAIESVSVDPPQPLPGQAVVLRWRASRADTIEIQPMGIVVQAGQGAGEYPFPNGFQAMPNLKLVAANRFGRAETPIPITLVAVVATPTPEPGTPSIDEWAVTPTIVAAGETVTVRWRVSGAESVTLEPFGTVDASGERQDVPAQAKTYRLTATNKGKSTVRAQEVTIRVPGVPPPVVKAFKVEPSSLVAIAGATVRLTWDTDKADQVTIEPGVGQAGPAGTRDVPAPSQNTTYVLVARNAGGETRSEAQVQVGAATCTVNGSGVKLYSGPGTVYASLRTLDNGALLTPVNRSPDGQWIEAQLQGGPDRGWTSASSVACNVSAGGLPVGQVPPTPALAAAISPTVPVVVTVPPAAPACPGAPTIGTFTASPATIASGGAASLSWGTLKNTDTAAIDGGIGSIALTGSRSVSPTTTTTYTLTATGCGGSATKQVTVNVTPPPAALPAIGGNYLMDGLPDRVIVVTDVGGGNYALEEATSPWPWKGTATFDGTNLVGNASFKLSAATMKVEGIRTTDGSFKIAYRFVKDDLGNPTTRVDNHVWNPTVVGKYLMDGLPDRIIVVGDLGGGKFAIQESTSPWPWKGTATFDGTNLTGTASFVGSAATMKVEGARTSDGSFKIAYRFVKDDLGNPTTRVDNHVWNPVP